MITGRRYTWATRMRPFRRWAVVQVSWRYERGVKRIRHDDISAHFTQKGARRAAIRLNQQAEEERWKL